MLLRFFRNEGRGISMQERGISMQERGISMQERGISMQGRGKQRPYERSEDNSFTAPEAACSIHNRNCLS